MKTNVFMTIALALVTSLTATAQSQRLQPWSGRSPKEMRDLRPSEGFSLPVRNLDDKQREEIGKIRTEQVKQRTQTRNLLMEKRAKLEVLQTADKPDMKEIDRVIDEIAALQGQEMKTQAANRQKIRSLLTEEQRANYDARRGDANPNRREASERFRGQRP